MKKYKIASILMFIHGAFMEIGGCLCLIPIFFVGSDQFDINQYVSFIVPYLRDNMNLMLAMGAIYGIVRVVGAIGLWKNRMWGLALSVINCAITMALMMFMLPAGIMDGILACSALILILTQWFGNQSALKLTDSTLPSGKVAAGRDGEGPDRRDAADGRGGTGQRNGEAYGGGIGR